MSSPKSVPFIQERQRIIEVQVRQTIARIEEGRGNVPMVVEAFVAGGEYINAQAAQGKSASFFFTYQGVEFEASCKPLPVAEEGAYAE